MDKLDKSIYRMEDELEENWMVTAERLYKLKNPDSKMDVPSFVYETVNKWREEWVLQQIHHNEILSFYDWCVKNKNN